MNRAEAWLLHSSCALVSATGVAWALVRYALEPSDPFAAYNHPSEPWLKSLHLWSAPLLVFAIGLIFQPHVRARLKSGFRARRRTGIVLAVSLAPMVFSGYLLQTTSSPSARSVFLWLHLASSAAWLCAYVLHQLQRKATARNLDELAGRSGPLDAIET